MDNEELNTEGLEDQTEEVQEEDLEEEAGEEPEEAEAGEEPQEEQPNTQHHEDQDERLRQAADQAIAKLGLVNHYTGESITSQAQMAEYRAAERNEKMDSMAARLGWSREDLDKFIGEDPRIVAAKEAEERAQKAQAVTQLNQEIRKITGMNPKIRDVNGLMSDPSWPRVLKRVQTQGLSVSDAYLLENQGSVMSGAGKAARRAAQQSMAGRAHMGTSRSVGAGAKEVPQDVLAIYKRVMPGKTIAEYQKHYNETFK